MGEIKILDCTLTEGEQLLNKSFEKTRMHGVLDGLKRSRIEIIDLGYLYNKSKKHESRLYCSVRQASKSSAPKPKGVQYSLSIHPDEPFSPMLLNDRFSESIDAIRITIRKKSIASDLKYCEFIQKKGYDIYVKPEKIQQYSMEEWSTLISLMNLLSPKVCYLSDDFGIMTSETIEPYITLANRELDAKISLGYYGYNGLKQAEEIATLLCQMRMERDVILDTSIAGIGQGAGHLNTQTMMTSLNEKQIDKHYNIKSLLEVQGKFIEPLYQQCMWGYSQLYQKAAKLQCDPEYVMCYDKKIPAALDEIIGAITQLTPEARSVYSAENAREALSEFRHKNFHLAVIIPTYNRSTGVRFYIETEGKTFLQYGVDLIFYDSSDNDETKDVIDMCGLPNVRYEKYTGKMDGITIDHKVQSAAAQFSKQYDYIWICRDRSMPNFPIIYEPLRQAMQNGCDFVVVYPHWIDPQYYGQKEYKDCRMLFKDMYGNMTSLGSIMFSAPVLKYIVEHYPIDEKNHGLWLVTPLFHYIATHKFRTILYINHSFNFIPEYTTSFWIKSNALLWLWAERWPVIMENLPTIYNNEKQAVLRGEGWYIPPFCNTLLLLSRAGGGFTLLDVYKHRVNLALVSDKALWKLYLISLLPAKLVSHYMEKPGSIFSKICNWTFGKILAPIKRGLGIIRRDIRALTIKGKKAEYSGIDYGAYVDCYAKNKDVESHLLWGNLTYIQDPLVTIVIPTNQRVDLLKDALESVLKQRKVDFKWDILVLDNMAYDEKRNETQQLIESINDQRILYYRNDKNIGAAGNMNRGAELARGKWMSLLHDDDILISEYLYRIGRRIQFMDGAKGKELGMISATHETFSGKCFKEDPVTKYNLAVRDYFLCSARDEGRLLRISPMELLVTGSVGIYAPTAGTLYLKKAYIECGGFNERDIASDIIIGYVLSEKYKVFRNETPLGFYRLHQGSESFHSLTTIEKNLFDFREYAYQRTLCGRLCGCLFKQEHFALEVRNLIGQGLQNCDEKHFKEYDTIMKYRPNILRELLFRITYKLYRLYVKHTAVVCKEKKA